MCVLYVYYIKHVIMYSNVQNIIHVYAYKYICLYAWLYSTCIHNMYASITYY